MRMMSLPGFARIARAKTIVLALALGAWALPACPAPSSAAFNVRVKLQVSADVESAVPSSAFCRIDPGPLTFGAIVTIVCATGAEVDIEAPRTAVPWPPIHGGAYRFTPLTGSELPGTPFSGGIVSYTGVGTVSSWRMVNLTGWNYLEMLIGW